MTGHGHGKGKARPDEGGLDTAFDRAWADAKNNGGTPGHYKAQITVRCDNPIRAYIVTLDQIDEDDSDDD